MPGKCTILGQLTLPVYWYVMKHRLMQYQEVFKALLNRPKINLTDMSVSYDKFSLHERSDNSVVTVGMGEFRNDQLDFCCN